MAAHIANNSPTKCAAKLPNGTHAPPPPPPSTTAMTGKEQRHDEQPTVARRPPTPSPTTPKQQQLSPAVNGCKHAPASTTADRPPLPHRRPQCSPPPRSSLAVRELNDLIRCRLCGGYLIDATTVIECLHSFCRTCIIGHIDSNTPKSRFCPFPDCDLQIHKTKPKLNIRSDPTLQDIVYKLVPGLFRNEMDRRKDFYAQEPESAVGLSSEERGLMCGERLIFTPDDIISLSIEYFPQVICYSLLPFSKCLNNGAFNSCPEWPVDAGQRRYLRCQGGMRVLHLKKWLRLKYDVRDDHEIEITYKHDPLLDDYTMMDLAYIYSWRRNGPLCLYYKIIEPPTAPSSPATPTSPRKMSALTKKSFSERAAASVTQPKPQLTSVSANGKSRHTVKHRHRVVGPVGGKRRRNGVVHESNLITTNPVNEPLTPVDTALISLRHILTARFSDAITKFL